MLGEHEEGVEVNVLVAVHLLERAQVEVVGGGGNALRDAVVKVELQPQKVPVGAVETRVGVLGLVPRRLKVVDEGVLAAGVVGVGERRAVVRAELAESEEEVGVGEGGILVVDEV